MSPLTSSHMRIKPLRFFLDAIASLAARIFSVAFTPAEPGDNLAEQGTNLAELGNVLANSVTLSKNPAQNTFASNATIYQSSTELSTFQAS